MVNVIKLKSKKSKSLLVGLTLAVGLSCMPSKAAQGGSICLNWSLAAAHAVYLFFQIIKGQELIESVLTGRTQEVEALIKTGTDLNFQGHLDWTALIWAACNGHTQIVKALIKAGANLNLKNQYGSTALIWAAQNGHTQVAEALIEAGANLNLQDQYGRTALMLAAQYGCADWYGHTTEVLEALIQAGANINAQDNLGWTALIGAACNGHTQVVQALIKAGADLNAQDNLGWTALIGAARNGHTQVVKTLLEAGANPNLQNKNGSTALSLARNKKNTVITTLLETFDRARQGSLQNAIVLSEQHTMHNQFLTMVQSMAIMAQTTKLPVDITMIVNEYTTDPLKNIRGTVEAHLDHLERNDLIEPFNGDGESLHQRLFEAQEQAPHNSTGSPCCPTNSLTTTTTPSTTATTTLLKTNNAQGATKK
jgi:ankyrin repeat protein